MCIILDTVYLYVCNVFLLTCHFIICQILYYAQVPSNNIILYLCIIINININIKVTLLALKCTVYLDRNYDRLTVLCIASQCKVRSEMVLCVYVSRHQCCGNYSSQVINYNYNYLAISRTHYHYHYSVASSNQLPLQLL